MSAVHPFAKQIIRRKEQGLGPAVAGFGLFIFGLFKVWQAYSTPIIQESKALRWGHYGVYLDGLLWITIGTILLIKSERSKKLAALEYDESEARIIRPNAFGKHDEVVVPIRSITRFQQSEPTVMDIYLMRNGEETIENVVGQADDISAFQSFVEAQKANPK